MKLLQKKDETKKVPSPERKAAIKPEAVKSAKARKAEPPKKAVKKTGGLSFAWIDTARQYLREVTYELRKVVWPSRKETVGSTVVVLVIVGISAAFLGVVDFILSRLVRLLVG